MSKRPEEIAQSALSTSKQVIKTHLFDIIAFGIVLAMLVLNLGVIELREITFDSLVNIMLECIPFFFTAVLLAVNFYYKGSFVGKNTDKFKNITKQYSDVVTNLSGYELEKLQEFCNEYNDNSLAKMQDSMLRRVAISYTRFNEITYDKAGNELQPLKVLTKQELLELYSKERVNVILKAKALTVKGINENILLGNTSSVDVTDLGKNEHELTNANTTLSAISYILSTLLLSMIGVRDVLMWGWAGLLIVAFKLIYILCSSLLKHFRGYNDITIHLSNHIARKTDILKQFKCWISKQDNSSNIANDELQSKL